MFARFDENPAMTLQVIKETKRYGRTEARTDVRTDNVKTVYPLQTKFAGGINILFRILTFAKPECDNVLQPEPRSGEGCNTLSHEGLANVNISSRFGLQHIITLGLGKR